MTTLIASYHNPGGGGQFRANLDGNQIYSGPIGSGQTALHTQTLMGWGCEGDGGCTSAIAFDALFNGQSLDAAHQQAVYNSLHKFYTRITPPLSGPTDLWPEVGVNPDQVYMVGASYGLRGQSLSYFGPLINVCQGTTATCEDIGQDVHGNFDVITASAFCGSNCTIQTAYNNAVAPNPPNHVATAPDVSAPTPAVRPHLAFNCVGSLPCMTGNGSEYLCSTASGGQPGSGSVAMGYKNWGVTAVAERTGGTNGTIFGFLRGSAVGFAAKDTASATNARTTFTSPAPDGVLHSVTLAEDPNNTSANLWVDGVRVNNANPMEFQNANVCLFASNSSGANALTGNIFEVDVVGFSSFGGGSHSLTGWPPSNTQIAAQRANQRAYWGF